MSVQCFVNNEKEPLKGPKQKIFFGEFIIVAQSKPVQYTGCISAHQRAKHERATHQPSNFKIGSNILTITKN
jgi:hypothetical protein